MTQIKVGNKRIELTHTDKVLFGRSGITKQEMLDYYQMIAPYMIPHMRDRLISMQRFPNGITGEGFFQKDAGVYFPSWIATKKVKRSSGGSVDYVIVNNAATLLYLANQGCMVFHTWLSRADKLEYPDRIIFDLDPSIDPLSKRGNNFRVICDIALTLKELIENLGLVPFVMTTGSRGLHVVIPIKRRYTFDHVYSVAQALAQQMLREYPQQLTMELRKAKRGTKIFIDVLRNQFGATGVTPYSVRPKEGAPIATPLVWSEVTSSTLVPQKYTLHNIERRIARVGDPWHDIQTHACSLTPVIKRLGL
jgi:bifunctional non-homologous end joining protein LigD